MNLLTLGCYGGFGYSNSTEVLQANTEQHSGGVYHNQLQKHLFRESGSLKMETKRHVIGCLNFRKNAVLLVCATFASCSSYHALQTSEWGESSKISRAHSGT